MDFSIITFCTKASIFSEWVLKQCVLLVFEVLLGALFVIAN